MRSSPRPLGLLSGRGRTLLLGALLAVSGLGLPRTAHADEASGTWTGNADAPRGNYYWERSTRVIAPSVQGRVESPRGVRIEGGYLIDAITSASQATGVTGDVAFTEIRHDVNLGVGTEIEIGGATQLGLNLFARLSLEPDYFSRGFGFNNTLSLRQRNHVLRLNGYYLNDNVGKVVRDPSPSNPDDLMATQRQYIGAMNALSLGLSYERTLSPTTLLIAGVDVAYLKGFQANVYRVVVPAGGGPPSPEAHPDKRTRTAAYLQIKQRLRRSGTTLAGYYRIYYDTWEILSQAPEVRVYQDINHFMMLRLRYRYYTQSAAFFYVPGGPPPDAQYRTADPKMTRFVDNTFGVTLVTDFGFLAGSAFDFFARARFDFGINYLLSTNRFGDGLMGQAGLRLPF